MELLANDGIKRILTLFEEAGNISGRTKLQKIVYILKNKEIPFRQKFKYHYNGPYSPDLQLEIEELIDRNILIEKEVNSYIHVINKDTEIEYEKDPWLSEKKDLIRFLNNQDFEKLEVTSTIYFLEKSGITDKGIIKKKIEALKPNLKDYIDSSFKLKEEISLM